MTAIRQLIALGPQWPTVDPFLFCAHHDDTYPAGLHDLGPAREELSGRQIGSDFGGKDGWSMYHGSVVPGFPQHPHRGFETISFLRAGVIDHADSLGATARFGAGDVQWMTAGAGIVHAEMFPLLDAEGPNPLHLFQIWLNLPSGDKMVEPHFSMLWSDTIPVVGGGGVDVTVIAGDLAGERAPTPPPHSWASRDEADLALWHGRMDAGSTWELPPARTAEAVRTLYVYRGGTLLVDGDEVPAEHGALLEQTTEARTLTAADDEVCWLLLQGRPIGEPVAQYGPFVMNTEAEIEQAFADYQRTQFGGWPWPAADPNHGPDKGRFALHADGTVDQPTADVGS